MQKSKLKSYLLLHLIVFIWGFTAVLGELITVREAALVWYRMGLAGVFLLIYALIVKKPLKLPMKEAAKIIFVGFLIAIHWVFFFRAINISNDNERKFAGKSKDNLEPRTAIGYTKDNKIIVFVCEGRSIDAAGLSLPAMASIMRDLGCTEAMNLDGGGSSCMLINGKITNTPSSKGVQREVPSVFLIERK